jgi:DNA-binding MarR family transcriptional regulator
VRKNPGSRSGTRRDLALTVLAQFRLIYGAVRQQHRQVEEVCGISGAQLWILHEVQRSSAIGVTELAARLSIHQSTCSQLVEKLVRRRMLTKRAVAGDKRRVGVCLTSLARKCLRTAPGPAEGLLPSALLKVPPDVLRRLRSDLDKVVFSLGTVDERYRDQPLSSL